MLPFLEGDSSLTLHHTNYNLLLLDLDVRFLVHFFFFLKVLHHNPLLILRKVIGQLFWLLHSGFIRYAQQRNFVLRHPLFIHLWANCNRQGQGLKRHSHGDKYKSLDTKEEVHQKFTASGNVVLHVPIEHASFTTYIADDGDATLVPVPNAPGDMVFFNSRLKHFAAPVTQQQMEELQRLDGREEEEEEGPETCRSTLAFDIREKPDFVFSIPFFHPDDPNFEFVGETTAKMRSKWKLNVASNLWMGVFEAPETNPRRQAIVRLIEKWGFHIEGNAVAASAALKSEL